jgi:predicted permease
MAKLIVDKIATNGAKIAAVIMLLAIAIFHAQINYINSGVLFGNSFVSRILFFCFQNARDQHGEGYFYLRTDDISKASTSIVMSLSIHT